MGLTEKVAQKMVRYFEKDVPRINHALIFRNIRTFNQIAAMLMITNVPT